MALRPGDRVAERYRVVRPLGRGGMASVFLIEDERTQTERVMKELRADRPELLAALRREFALLSSTTHPCLIRVHDFGTWRVRGEKHHYYTADYVEGAPLARWAARAKADCARPAVDALSALQALHALGVRHGDVSPENIVVRGDGRGVLLDLGCVQPLDNACHEVTGTPGFIAPELLAGAAGDARADLFSLGQTIRWAHEAAGVPLTGKLKTLCQRLTAEAPAQRPASAREALEILGRKASRDASLASVASGLVGRDRELSQFSEWLRHFVADERAEPVLWLRGETSVGSSRLVREFVSAAELELDVLRARGDELRPVSWLISSASGLAKRDLAAADVIRACRALAERTEPLLVVLEDAQRLDPSEADLLTTFLRALSEAPRVACLVSAHDAPPVACLELVLEPLSLDALRELTLDALSRGALADLFERTQGYPGRVQAWLQGARTPNLHPPVNRVAPGVERERLDGGNTPQAKRALAVLLALGGDSELSHPLLDLEGLQPYLDAGWLRREGSRIRVGWRVTQQWLKALVPSELVQAHRALADFYETGDTAASSEQRQLDVIYHTACAGELTRARALFANAESAWRKQPRPFAARLLPLFRESASDDWLFARAELALEAAEYDDVLRAVARVLRRRRGDEGEKRCRLVAADALLRLGRPRRAERLLRQLSGEGAAEPWRAMALERCARARLQAGDPRACEVLARRALPLASDSTTKRALKELLGISASYLGRANDAEAAFSELLRGADADTPPRERSRWLAQRAIALFRGGQAFAALDDYRQALELSDRAGLDDHFCVNSLNLGTVQQKLGDWGAALVSYEQGLRVAHAIGRESSELTLRFNLANLLVEIGDFVRAGNELDALSARTEATLNARFAPLIALARAELHIEQRSFERAGEELAAARAGFSATGLERELAEVDVCEAELALARGLLDVARRAAEQALSAAEKLLAGDLTLRARAALARAASSSEPGAARALEALVGEAEALGERALAARVATELHRSALEQGSPAAAQYGARALRLWDQLGASMPEALRETFWRDARRASLTLHTRSERSSNADREALHKLLSLSRRVNSSLALERVFEYAVDAAVEVTQAERGFLILDEADERRIVAQRPSDDALHPPSRAIVERVVASEVAVLTTDAETDLRFASPGSIHSLKLKSVLCVPVLTPAQRIGLLYVDSRVQRGRFQEREQELLSALADQVAVAVSNARLHRALERQREELAEQKRLVERLARVKDRELEKLRERFEEQQRSLSLRYDYSRIVGQSAPMRRVFEQLDRITDSSVDVLIQGESGTGKELIARALHQNGPRHGRPFVGINCAALPENLLESELFGHVRGAFTGAERDKRGLLLEAHGGTLFLDEIAELPLPMQAKLLRVLQEREVRPVGGVRALPIDVRIVSASHRDLRGLVENGRFREDLYYRLAVVVVRLPPLRERSEDLPLLARNILERLANDAGRPVPELTSDARQRLLAHAFPGNVRELENILTRAFVLSEGTRIRGADLDLTRNAPRKLSRTRREYERDERAELIEALQRTRWNVSLVSRELGIPRNTLYRKLRRHGLLERPATP